jgi:HD-GYP domain-containing protein (c-di-GMP phosphodiesterase class II)
MILDFRKRKARRHHVSFSLWSILGMHFGSFFNFYAGKIQRGRPGLLTITMIRQWKIQTGHWFDFGFRNPQWKCFMRKQEIKTETRNQDLRMRGEAVNRGAFEFHTVITDVSEHKQAAEKLSPILGIFRKAMGGIIPVISDSVEAKDPFTVDHQRRVADLSRAIGGEMGLDVDQQDGLLLAGIIHDLGKVSIPAKVLNKPGKLSKIEYQLVQAHPQTGHDILKGIDFPWPLAQIVLQHHERLNGSGYPRGLKGAEISPEAQILMVADVVEAMSSCRPYRSALGIDAALGEIEKNKGILYDQGVVKMCARLFREKGFGFE